MLRSFVLVVAAMIFTAALIGALVDPGVWPSALFAGVVVVAIVFERQHYKAAQARPVEPGWRATSERFIDEASGRALTVWVDPATGERRYVDDGDNPLIDSANHSQR